MLSRFAPWSPGLLVLLLGFGSLSLSADPTMGEARRGLAKFFRLHAEFLDRAAAGPADVVFMGDSITYGWRNHSRIWEKNWGAYQPANFGIGGDRTQHVIWRIAQGELDQLSPQVVVLMIGTNNTGTDSAPGIAAGNRKIVAMIRELKPQTKVLLLGVFPRGPRVNGDGSADPWEMKMEKIHAINAELAQLDDGHMVRYLDIGPKFMTADGQITQTIMPDQLHLSAAGYQIWAEAMAPLLAEMVASGPGE